MSDRCHDARGRRAAVLRVHAVRREEPALKERHITINEQLDPLASRQPTVAVLSVDALLAAALADRL